MGEGFIYSYINRQITNPMIFLLASLSQIRFWATLSSLSSNSDTIFDYLQLLYCEIRLD